MEPSAEDVDGSLVGSTFSPSYFIQQPTVPYYHSPSVLKEIAQDGRLLYAAAPSPQPAVQYPSASPVSLATFPQNSAAAPPSQSARPLAPLQKDFYTFRPQPAQYSQPLAAASTINSSQPPRREVQWQNSTVDNPPASVRNAGGSNKSQSIQRSPPSRQSLSQATSPSVTKLQARGPAVLAAEEIAKAVQKAVDQAREGGSESLAHAIELLHEESLHTPRLANTLQSVLASRPTPEQKAEFDAYIGQAQQKYISSIKLSKKIEKQRVLEQKRVEERLALLASGGAPVLGAGTDQLFHAFPGESPFTLSSTKSPRRRRLPITTSRESRKIKKSSTMAGAPLLGDSDSSSLSDIAAGSDEELGLDSIPSSIGATPGPVKQPRPTTRLRDSKPQSLLSTVLGKRPLGKSSRGRGHHKRSAKDAGLTPDPEDPELTAKRQKYQDKLKFDDYHVKPSALRLSLPQGSHKGLINTKIKLSVPKSTPLTNGHASGRSTPISSTKLQLPQFGNATQQKSSKASRPDATNLTAAGAPVKLQRKARVKLSPMKKRQPAGGRPRGPGGDRDSAARDSEQLSDDDDVGSTNDDYCSACSGQGELLCCDGCDRAFHAACLDPPLDIDTIGESWYCCICTANRNPLSPRPRGLLTALTNTVLKKNPVNYSLPLSLRDYFEDVKTNEDGGYEYALIPKKQSRIGYDEEPDYFALKDNKGSCRLCHRCGQAPLTDVKMIDCDYCPLHWHLDCLDPPMANPPYRGTSGRPRKKWMCPSHAVHDLNMTAARPSSDAKAVANARVFKQRRPKKVKIVDVAMRRGFKNNGNIEVLLEDSDGDPREAEEGVIHRLGERGIILDFIEQMRKRRSVPRYIDDFDGRSLAEQQAVLYLTNMATHGQVPDSDQVSDLVRALISEAWPDVVALDKTFSAHHRLTASPTPPVVSATASQSEMLFDHSVPNVVNERALLLCLRELINKRLGHITPPESMDMDS